MRAPRNSQGAFSLIEIIIVVAILAILMAIVGVSMRSAHLQSIDRKNVAAARAMWDGIILYRLDRGGEMPAASDLTAAAFVSASAPSKPYVKRWPEDGQGEPLTVATGSGAEPPDTGTPQSIVYSTSTDASCSCNLTGWLAAYGRNGQALFVRRVGPAIDVGGTAGGLTS